MIRWGRTIGLLIVLLLAGCAGQGDLTPTRTVSLVPLAGSVISGTHLTDLGSNLEIEFNEIRPGGQFVLIKLPDRPSIMAEQWLGTDSVLHLAKATDRGIEIGLVPLTEYAGEQVNLSIELGPTSRVASTSPKGPRNSVHDLVIEALGGGQYRLSWTEVHNGDYNLNGLVEVSDLTPIGQYYGQQVTVDSAPAWVDGNKDGFITVSDITRIGQNYDSFLSGYVVMRNEDPLPSPDDGGEITVRRQQSTHLEPPTYTIELPGDVGDSWQVFPVQEGQPVDETSISNTVISEPAVIDSDLLIEFAFTGDLTFDVSSRGGTTINDGHQILRIIDPSEIVDGMEVGDRLMLSELGRTEMVGGDVLVSDLPRGVPLMLDIIYATEVDLRNAIPWMIQYDDEDKPIIEDEYLSVTSMPFTLPEVITEPMQIIGNVLLLAKPTPGYKVVSSYTCIENGDVLGQVAKARELDYPAGLVKRTVNDELIANAATLMDTDRDCVSNHLLEADQDIIEYGEAFNLDLYIRGEIDESFDMTTGDLVLKNAWFINPEGGEVSAGTFTLKFSENTKFGLYAGDPELDTIITPYDVNTLMIGDTVRVKYFVYKKTIGPPESVWAEIVAVTP